MTKGNLTIVAIQKARAGLNHLNNGRKICDDEGASRFINERGFVLLMPIEGIPLPSLSEADDARPWPGFACTDRSWAWKETLPGHKQCVYTKFFQGRGTFISWGLYPSFLRVYGPEGDPDYEYEQGRLERTERELYKIVEAHGPIDSRELWKRSKSVFGDKRSRFTAAMDRLQSRFFLTVAGGSLEGWSIHYWDLVERQAPPEVLQSLPGIEEARAAILRQTIINAYAISPSKLRSILRWSPEDIQRNLDKLLDERLVVKVRVEGETHAWVMVPEPDVTEV